MKVFFLHRASWLKRSLGLLSLCSSVCLLASCDIQPPKYKTPVDMAGEIMAKSEVENAKQQKLIDSKKLSTPIKIALMPKAGKSDTAHNTLYNKHFNLVVNNIDARLFFHNLSQSTPFNIIVDPKITGTISLDLKSVTMPQIFQTLKDLYGYDYVSTAAGFEVMAPQLQTAMFRVNYLDIKRVVDSKTSLDSSDLVDAGSTTTSVNGSTDTSSTTTPATRSSQVTNSVETTATIAFWDNVTDSLKSLVGTDGGRTVTVNANSGVIVIKAYPNELRRAREFIDRMQSSANRQVVLEVSIMEVQLNDSFQAGINWKLLGLETSMGAVGIAGATPFTTITMTDGNNEAVISLLKQQGNVQVLSSPRVLTVNNQQAVIKVGSENYYVTGITSTPVTSTTDTSTTTMSSTVNLTPFFSGITLNITPQIDYNEQVMLHVHPTLTVVKQEDKTIDLGNGQTMVLPTASETLREYDSIIRASNNQLIVIGGMITNSISETIGSLPGVGTIPFIGSLFRFNTQISGKVELVIVLKPIAINEFPESIVQELKDSQQRMNDMDRGFHQGSMVDILGNEGELSN